MRGIFGLLPFGGVAVRRLLVLVAALGLLVLLCCGGGGLSCEGDELVDLVIEKSRQYPTHIGDTPLTYISNREELNDAGDWIYCAGVGMMEDGTFELIQYNASKDASGLDEVGFGLR